MEISWVPINIWIFQAVWIHLYIPFNTISIYIVHMKGQMFFYVFVGIE